MILGALDINLHNSIILDRQIVSYDCKHQIHERDSIFKLVDDVKQKTNKAQKNIGILVFCSVAISRTGTLNEAKEKLKRLQHHNNCYITCANSSIVYDEIVTGLIDECRKNLKISRGLDIYEVVLFYP